eukprot:g881.t1
MKPSPKQSRNILSKQMNCVWIGALILLLCVGCLLLWNVSSPYSGLSTRKFRLGLTYNKDSAATAAQLPQVDFTSPLCRTFFSQHGEDSQLFIQYWAYPEVKRDGVFLEIGAYTGRELSNSYWYEMCLGWTGVLIEGQPVAAQALRNNRPNATNFEAAACEKDEGTVTFIGGATGLSGEVSKMPEAFIKGVYKDLNKGTTETHEVKCRLISSMLREAGVDHIDFWTLDVEGAEFTVLRTFDWEHVAVHVLVIENDKDEAVEYPRRHALLTSKGMQYVGPLFNNELWVNPNYPNIIFPSSNKKQSALV